MSTNEKLSDEIAKYFHTFEKCAYDSPDEIIEAVRALEVENERLGYLAGLREAEQRDFKNLKEIHHEAQNFIKQVVDTRDTMRAELNAACEDYRISHGNFVRCNRALQETVRERDASRADADCTAESNRRLTTERDAALAKVDALGESIIGVRQQRDRFVLEAAEWKKWCKTLFAKLAMVREWSKVNSITHLATDRLTAILDMSLETKSAESSAVCAEYDIIEREVVLWERNGVWGVHHLGFELFSAAMEPATKIAQATVQFRVPRPTKKTLVERLESWNNHGGSVAEWDAIVADARNLEGGK